MGPEHHAQQQDAQTEHGRRQQAQGAPGWRSLERLGDLGRCGALDLADQRHHVPGRDAGACRRRPWIDANDLDAYAGNGTHGEAQQIRLDRCRRCVDGRQLDLQWFPSAAYAEEERIAGAQAGQARLPVLDGGDDFGTDRLDHVRHGKHFRGRAPRVHPGDDNTCIRAGHGGDRRGQLLHFHAKPSANPGSLTHQTFGETDHGLRRKDGGAPLVFDRQTDQCAIVREHKGTGRQVGLRRCRQDRLRPHQADGRIEWTDKDWSQRCPRAGDVADEQVPGGLQALGRPQWQRHRRGRRDPDDGQTRRAVAPEHDGIGGGRHPRCTARRREQGDDDVIVNTQRREHVLSELEGDKGRRKP